MTPLRLLPEAELDLLQAASWYEREQLGLGEAFLASVQSSFDDIEEAPRRFLIVKNKVRRAIVDHFPFGSSLSSTDKSQLSSR